MNVAGLLLLSAALGGEPWAHGDLNVTEGLVVWLDAGRLNEARQAQNLPPLKNGDKVPAWYDASGGRHVVEQADEKAQPVYYDGAVRFNGDNAFLEALKIAPASQEMTIVAVAAVFSNTGGFRALLATNKEGQNDYTSGVNIDQGPWRSDKFNVINVEGSGFGGFNNLLTQPVSFGSVRRIAVTTAPGAGGTKLYVDGRLNGQRDRADSTLGLDRLTVGARCFNNEGGRPNPRGTFEGDLFEVLIYNRLLSDSELKRLDAYLIARHGENKTIALPAKPGLGKPLVTVEDPPALQMLAPGFVVREFPEHLPNINNVKYRSDGKLVALAYNGDVYLLSRREDREATAGRVEDHVETFWKNEGQITSPIGMALTPPGYPRGTGLFVACKGKLALIVDTDGDDRADQEMAVSTTGWTPLPHGVDALGCAVDASGNIYFGLGAANFFNAYQIDKEGKSHFDLHSQRGTILKLEADFSRQTPIVTGIRFPVALAFNRHGDLFATDQEGATWLPNGNPFDELLHIQPGRHYGFPPRHPKHLPDVIDEPSVFDYKPQHQSTCGLNFNEPAEGGKFFGPDHWDGDALVTGYSRGKLYRTKVVKTPAGYVAHNSNLACLNMMPSDACVSPQGELVVAVHSGVPDWGTGPTGRGKLYKVFYRDRQLAQPAVAWAASPQEVRVAFDRQVDPEQLRDVQRRLLIEYGRYVSPGDRFEVHRPGYEVVRQQLETPRHELAILGVQLTSDRRTLVVNTAPHPEAVSYALTLSEQESAKDKEVGELPQHGAIDLGYDLTGASARWQSKGGDRQWSGWLPHLDLAVARSFTAASAEHAALWQALESPGWLTIETRLDLWQMLRPAVQPGSTLDYALPDEEVMITLASNRPIEATTSDGSVAGATNVKGNSSLELRFKPKANEPIPLQVRLATGKATALAVSYKTAENDRARALPLRRLLLPWASLAAPSEAITERKIPELAGGDWFRGREIFFGQQARCSSCHSLRGQGGNLGADLSNLIHRDYASVLRDIRFPSAAINPDYITHVVTLDDGRILQGTIRTEENRLLVGDSTGKQTTIDRDQVDTLTPTGLSIMPEGIDKALPAEALRDLLTFLLTEPLQPAALERDDAPPPRRRAEVEAVLAGSKQVIAPRKLNIVLASGPKDHGPGEHDYPLWQNRWSSLLKLSDQVNVTTAKGWPTPQQFEEADTIVFYSNNPGWSAVKAAELDRHLARGRGLVYIHYAVDGHKEVEALADRIGLAWRGGASRFRHGALEIDFSKSKHPITRGFQKLSLIDESYWNLIGDPRGVDVLGTGVEQEAARPLFWTREQGRGRVFVSIPGHYTWTFDDPLFRLLLLRAIAWTAHDEVDRFNELVTMGARISP